MEPKDQHVFELDEPAARSHTPAGWPIQVIEIQTSGKAPTEFGPTVYRFGAPMTVSVIVPRRGWTLVKKMLPPTPS